MREELTALDSKREVEFALTVSIFSNAINQMQKYTGVKSETLLYILGKTFGHVLADEISAQDLDGAIKEISTILRRLGLGSMSITQKDPLTITVRGCKGCTQIPDENEIIACKYREGLLKAVLDRYLEANSYVKHISSFGKIEGKKRCWFAVVKLENAEST